MIFYKGGVVRHFKLFSKQLAWLYWKEINVNHFVTIAKLSKDSNCSTVFRHWHWFWWKLLRHLVVTEKREKMCKLDFNDRTLSDNVRVVTWKWRLLKSNLGYLFCSHIVFSSVNLCDFYYRLNNILCYCNIYLLE